MKESNKYEGCCNFTLPDKLSECKNDLRGFRIESVIMDQDGNCFDQDQNYIGQGVLVDGRLSVTLIFDAPTSST